MICWGQRNCCGVFVDRSKSDRCDCLRDYCIRDYEPEERITVREKELGFVDDYLSTMTDEHLHELDKMLRIKSISGNVDYQKQTRQIINRLAQRLTELEFDVEVVEVPPKGNEPMQYAIFANYFSTPAKNVMLIYGNVDVKDVKEEDREKVGWTHPPFQLTEKDGMLYGSGISSSKGPVFCWLQVAEGWLKETYDLPVNLKFVIDTFGNASNVSLKDIIDVRKDFFRGVDLVMGITNLWITPQTPMLSISHSGYIYFELEVRHKKKSKDEECASATREPLAELCLLMNTLTDKQGELAKKLQRHVMPVTQNDWHILSDAEVGIMEFKESLGVTRLQHESCKQLFLKHRWCMPAITMHSVNMPKYASSRDMHVPERIVAKFSVKLVPDQSVEYVGFLVRQHLDCAYCRLKCEHRIDLRTLDSVPPLKEHRHAPFNLSAQRAYERVFDVEAAIPDTVHLCMPMLNELRRHCLAKAQVIGVPFCSVHMRPGQPNECLTFAEYLKNKKLFNALLYEVAMVPADCKCTEVKDFCYGAGKSTDHDFIRMLEPRNVRTHVLYEVDEDEIDRAPSLSHVFPTPAKLILGEAHAKLDNQPQPQT